MSVKMRLTGAKELKAALQNLPLDDNRDGIARRVLKEAGKPILAAARSMAPVDTGRLKKAIFMRSQRVQRGDVTVAIGVRRGRVFYGWFQEFGTKYLPPQPFMRPAWDAHKGDLIRKIGAMLWDEVRVRVKRGGGTMPAASALDVETT
jgi:HK97 gp10 family phage protein